MTAQRVALKEIPLRKIAYLKCQGSWRQLPRILDRLNQITAERGLAPAGPVGGIYYNTPAEVDTQDLAWEVYYPVDFNVAEIVESSGFGTRELPPARVAAIVHKGSYRTAGSSSAILEQWLHNKELKAPGPAEEIYLSDITDSQKEQEIEIRLPVSSR